MKKGHLNHSDVVGRLLIFVRTENKSQLVRMIFAALFIAIQPFLGVVLPKIAIGTIERYGKDATLPLAKVMAIYFVIAGFIGFMSAYLSRVTDSENIRLRMHYLALLSKKIQNMDYKYVEDATFWEKNERAMQAGSSSGNGIELLLNLIYKAPAYLLTLIAMAVVAFTLSPIVTPSAFEELFKAYYNSLTVLKDNGYHSISFPLISSGIFGGGLPNPAGESTRQCLKAYKQFVQDYPDYDIDVKLCAFGQSEMIQAQKEFENL